MLRVKDLIKKLQDLDSETIIGVDIGDDLVDAYYHEDNYDVDFFIDEDHIDLYRNEKGEQRVFFRLKEIDTSSMTIEQQKKELGYYPSLYPPIEIWKRVDEK